MVLKSFDLIKENYYTGKPAVDTAHWYVCACPEFRLVHHVRALICALIDHMGSGLVLFALTADLEEGWVCWIKVWARCASFHLLLQLLLARHLFWHLCQSKIVCSIDNLSSCWALAYVECPVSLSYSSDNTQSWIAGFNQALITC